MKPIGRVVATERTPTTTGNVRFWIDESTRLKPFDIVRLLPPNSSLEGEFYVIIKEIHQVSDEPSALSGYISADFGRADLHPRLERIVTTYADATVLYNTHGNEMPVPHGSAVMWPTESGVRRALGIDDFERKTPSGFITMSGPDSTPISIPIDLDADYLVGPEGAHLNISGISGLATKTSYVMFLVTSIQQRQNLTWKTSDRASFLILNVKGTDLLNIHVHATDMSAETQADWRKCDLEPKPVQDVVYFFPYSSLSAHANAQTKLSSKRVSSYIQSSIGFRYYYDIEDGLERLRLLVEDVDDPNQTLVSCAEQCQEESDRWSSWRGFHSIVKDWCKKGGSPVAKIPVVSWRRFHRLVGQRTKNGIFTEPPRNADQLHAVPMEEVISHLRPGRVVVVDIAELPDYIQSFVVGDIISLLRRFKTVTFADTNDDDFDIETIHTGPVVLVADELNKFAPKHYAKRTITRHLREISERGRSEGIILFGAEQFRTGVDSSVTGNSSTQVFGRTTAVESNRDVEIRELPGNQRQRVPFLKKGELLVSHTRFSAGTLKIRFPRNAYATDPPEDT